MPRRSGSLQISETNAVVETTVGTTNALPELLRGRYFRYRVNTTDRGELTKTKFEMYRFYQFYLNQSLSLEAKNHLQPQIRVGTQPNYRSG
jgi:hypothetical protein